MPEQDEAEEQPGAPPVEPQPESFPPDDSAQPVELQSPEGELPVEAAQPDVAQSVEIAPDVAQSAEIASSEETEPAALPEEPQLEQVAEQPEVAPPRQLSRRERETVERQNRRFAACGRCGYFVADCRNYLGEAALVDAMLEGEDGWLRLEGDETFRRLLMYAYGIQIDAGYDFFDGSCPECRRRFVYIARAEHPTRLKIQI